MGTISAPLLVLCQRGILEREVHRKFRCGVCSFKYRLLGLIYIFPRTACLDDAVHVARGVQSLRWCFGLSANHISGTQAFCCHREGSVPLVNIPETLRFEFRG